MRLQAMRMLALNFRFVLVFGNSRVGAQFRNKLTLCNVKIVLQTGGNVKLCRHVQRGQGGGRKLGILLYG